MTQNDVALSVDAPQRHRERARASAHNPFTAMASRRPPTLADAEILRGSEAARAAADATAPDEDATLTLEPEPATETSPVDASTATAVPTTAARKRTSKRS